MENKNLKNKAVAYCRVSSKEQEETGYSLPAQEKLLVEYANRKDFNLIKVFPVAESASGEKQRKIFNEMMDYMKKKNINILLCEKVDRLTRNLKEAVVINDWIEAETERQVHFVKQNLVIHRNAKSDEKFRWDIEIVLAKKYISNLSEEVKKGQKEKIAQGWLPSRPPMGYRTIGEKGHKTHVLDEKVAPFIKKTFEMYASGNYSMKAIVELLYKEGFRSRNGYKLAKNRMEAILKEPFYYGAIPWNGQIIPDGKHEPIITKEMYDKVQDIRLGRKTPHFNRHSFIFSKLFKCQECECTITAEIQKGIIYYHCNHYKNCSQKRYTPEEKIEEKLVGVFEFFKSITKKEAEEIKTKIKKNHAEEIKYKENALKSLNERYTSLQGRLDRLYDDRLDQKITNDFWEKKNKEITEEQKQIQDQITKIKSEEAKYFEIWLNIIDLAFRAKEIYAKRSPAEKRLLLSHIFSNLMLNDKEALYKLKKPVEVLARRVQERIDREKTFEPKNTLPGKVKSIISSKNNSLLQTWDDVRIEILLNK